ncbi:phospho-2-dehydro-3-deoxyheptonate aldolase, partial [Arthrobacter sp. Hiyo6]
PDTHLILRGGRKGPNYSGADILAASGKLAAKGLNPRLIVDASHANSGKSHHRQAEVTLEIGAQLEDGGAAAGAIAGVMLESFLVGGAQNLDVADHAAGIDDLVYGQSVTDAAWNGTSPPRCWANSRPRQGSAEVRWSADLVPVFQR